MVSTRLSRQPKRSGGAAASPAKPPRVQIKGRVVKRVVKPKKALAVRVKKEEGGEGDATQAASAVVKKEEEREEKVDVGGPFPTFARPFEEECRGVTEGNASLYIYLSFVLLSLHSPPPPSPLTQGPPPLALAPLFAV